VWRVSGVPARCAGVRAEATGAAVTQRDVILHVLESAAALCLDSDEERRVVAAALDAALYARPEAQLIREEFAHAKTIGDRLVVTRGIGGLREGALLAAAHRLATGEA
jgi:hypothetical protein